MRPKLQSVHRRDLRRVSVRTNIVDGRVEHSVLLDCSPMPASDEYPSGALTVSRALQALVAPTSSRPTRASRAVRAWRGGAAVGRRRHGVPRLPDRPGGHLARPRPPGRRRAIQEPAARLLQSGNLFYSEPGMHSPSAFAVPRWVARCTSPTPAPRPTSGPECRAQGQAGRHDHLAAAWLSRPHVRLAVGDAAGVPAGAVRARSCRASSRSADRRGRLRRVDERTAAVLLEPVQGESGCGCSTTSCCTPPARPATSTARRWIFDEVQCGSALRHAVGLRDAGVVPDLLTSANALPTGCRSWRADLLAALRRRLRARRPRLDVRRRPGCLRRGAGGARRRERPATARLRPGARWPPRRRPGVAARGRRGAWPRPDARLRLRRRWRAGARRRALLEQRLVLNATGPATLRLLPPLTITSEEIDDALRRLRALL